MNPRKNFKSDLDARKGLFLQIGLVIALGLSWMAFEWRTYEGGLIDLGALDALTDDEDMLVTNRTPPLPPPPLPAPIEIFKIVDNKIDIVELDLISTEIDDDATVEIMEVESEEVFNFVNVENKPIFPGCEDMATEEERFNCFNVKTRQFIGKNFEFPEMARQMGIQGKVWVSFIIEKDGRITDVAVDRGVDKLLDEEAVRVVRMFPKMTPAKVGGRSVRMRYSLPINARLQ